MNCYFFRPARIAGQDPKWNLTWYRDMFIVIDIDAGKARRRAASFFAFENTTIENSPWLDASLSMCSEIDQWSDATPTSASICFRKSLNEAQQSLLRDRFERG